MLITVIAATRETKVGKKRECKNESYSIGSRKRLGNRKMPAALLTWTASATEIEYVIHEQFRALGMQNVLMSRDCVIGEKNVGKKREAKNDRYGFGGRKRLGKQNDASSAADMDGFKQGRYNDGFGGR